MNTKEILSHIINQYFTTVIGHKDVPPFIYMGNSNKSVRYPLPKETNPLSSLLNAEFIRYSVMKELFSFVCFITRAMTILPSDLSKMTDTEIASLNTIEKLSKHPNGKEVIQFNLEINGKLFLRSFEIKRGFGDLIVNMTAIDELTTDCNLSDIQGNGMMTDFFSGLKTDLLQQQPEMIDNFNMQLTGLLDPKNQVSHNSTKH